MSQFKYLLYHRFFRFIVECAVKHIFVVLAIQLPLDLNDSVPVFHNWNYGCLNIAYQLFF